AGTLSFAEMERLTDQFAAYLRFELGLAKGDRVAIQSPNCLAYPIFLFGAAKAGCVIVNINPLYMPSEIEHALSDSGARLLLMIDMFADKLEAVIPKSQVETVLITSVADFFPPVSKFIVKTVQRLKKMVPKVPVPAKPFTEALKIGARHLDGGRTIPITEVELDDLLALQYTGGTTGRPKGAMLTHRNLVANIAQSHNNLQNNLQDNRTTLTPLPMYHIFALGVSGVIYSIGGHNVLIPSPRPITNLKPAFEKYNISFMPGVNTLFVALLNEEWFRANPPREMSAVGGGAAVQDAVAARWKEVVGTRIYQGYGLTETSPVVTSTPLDSPEKIGSIGVPMADTYVRIVDEDGKPVPVGESGELIIKGPQVMKGYWQRPDATAEVLRDGWFYTGDIARMDEDGFFYIVDRKTDMVLVSGFNVYPAEVEEAIMQHPGVLEVGVIGVPDEATAEAVRAYVVKRDPTLTEEALREHCRKYLTAYKVPKQILFREELPKTPVGKVLRKDLRAEALRELGRT
ncbi:MAG TPA: AMP-binding protein, partial [Gammaproteobacteria bacterium]|nr:AMP-binding protein [Gammaproteobacteria bacterium]